METKIRKQNFVVVERILGMFVASSYAFTKALSDKNLLLIYDFFF